MLQFHNTAFERQVSESIKIRNNAKHHLLNSKGEYNRCALPRLGLKMGTREYSKAKEEEDTEEERNIEEKIRMLRKRAGKASQRRHGKESSAPKRRKTGEMNEYKESRRVELVKITTSAKWRARRNLRRDVTSRTKKTEKAAKRHQAVP